MNRDDYRRRHAQNFDFEPGSHEHRGRGGYGGSHWPRFGEAGWGGHDDRAPVGAYRGGEWGFSSNPSVYTSDMDYGRGDRGPDVSHRGKGPKNFKRSDDRLKEQICEALSDHHEIDASDIEVSVKDGEVTLTGTVDQRQTKRMAEDVAESINGITEVHNQLRLKTSKTQQPVNPQNRPH